MPLIAFDPEGCVPEHDENSPHAPTVPIVMILAVLAPVACSTEGERPADMSAASHRRAAASHGGEARQHSARYDPEAARVRSVSAPDLEYGVDGVNPVSATPHYRTEVYNPTSVHRETARGHRNHAEAHARAAAALEKFEQAECASFPPEVRRVCPLLGDVLSVEALEEPGAGGSRRMGVRLLFADDVNMDAVAAHARCHVAFAAAQGFSGMPECPLYVPPARAPDEQPPRGVRVERGRVPHTLDLLVTDESQLDALRRRAREHISP